MSKKKHKNPLNMKKKQNKQKLETGIKPTGLGFPLITKNINNLWRWDTLEDVVFK